MLSICEFRVNRLREGPTFFLRVSTKLPFTRVRDAYEQRLAEVWCTSGRTVAIAVSYGEPTTEGLLQWQTRSEVTMTSPAHISSSSH